MIFKCTKGYYGIIKAYIYEKFHSHSEIKVILLMTSGGGGQPMPSVTCISVNIIGFKVCSILYATQWTHFRALMWQPHDATPTWK